MPDDIFYSLYIEDLNKVSEEELGRSLTSDEIEEIIPDICERIHWYDIIAEVINGKISQ